MKIAIIYDCIFPWTVGGAERWYTNLAGRLADDHDVTYLTLTQWDPDDAPDERYEVVSVGPRMALYDDAGRRRIGPPLRYGWGVFWHLLRHGGRYDIVHGASFPYFSVIGAWLALLPHRRTKLLVDWHEVWSLHYWQGYLGRVGGRVGYLIQEFCKRLPDHSFVESHMFAARLPRKHLTQLTGLFREPDPLPDPRPAASPPHAVFAGRHIPEKNVTAIPAAIVAARRQVPDLRATIFGSGPDTEAVRAEIERVGAGEFVTLPGFVSSEELEDGLATAACLVHPSEREGYGMVVIESSCIGTPVVVVAGEDNAAVELVEQGQNGEVSASIDPDELGETITRVVEAGEPMRRSARDWYMRNRGALSVEDSLEKILAVYAEFGGNR